MASTTPSPSTSGTIVSPRSVAAPAAGTARRGATKRHPHSFWWYLKWFFISLQLVIFCVIVATVSIGKSLYDQLNKIMPDTRFITARNKAEPTRIYAADGSLLAEFKGDQREWISISDLKVKRKRNGKTRTELGNLAKATLAIEDARFYKHPGMDAYRIAGAAVANVKNPDGIQQGGSTITEQLAVNIYLTRTKTLARRLQTALLALQLEKRFSKDEILELYLNEIYYGNRAYGCEAAARTYFGKAAKDLNIAQAAFLAGLPQQPGRLDPFDEETFPRAKKRQRLVLKAMLEKEKQLLGVGINWSQYLQAVKDESIHTQILKSKARHLAERRRNKDWRSPYFVAYVKQYLQKQYHWTDEFLSKSGLKIYTTLDPKIQAAAEKAMNRRLDNLGQSKLQGALVCIDPWSGHVVAMYGGRDFYDKKTGQFNRATQASRQPGSTFKPFVYATAMEMGYSPGSTVDDKPTKIDGWSPKNYDFKHRGKMQFRTALAISNNVAAARILNRVGVQNVIEKSHLMGIESPLVPYASLALGSSEITLLENTSAFGVFATRGLRADPTPVKRVMNYAGEILMEQPTPVYGARVMTEQAGDNMWEMLRYVVTNGTGENASIPGVDVIGKTGTTSNNKDVWFMGATRKLACGVWIGFDWPKDLGGGSAGGEWCAPAWRSFMLNALDIWSQRNPVEKMIEDTRTTQLQRIRAQQFKKYVRHTVCRASRQLATSDCLNTHVASFSTGGASGGGPTQYCDWHSDQVRVRQLDQGANDVAQPGDLTYNSNPDESTPGAEGPARRESTLEGDGETGNIPASDGAPESGSSDDGSPQRQGARNRDDRVARRNSVAREVSVDTSVTLDGGASEIGSADEVVVTVCAESGQLARSRCPVTLQQFFLKSDAPRGRCSMHR